MTSKGPTIKDIALRAGVSYSTVSRALNDKKGVKPSVRDYIYRIARDLEYAPHSSAKALVQKRVGMIGVIIPRTNEFAFQNPFYSHILLGLGNVANERGFHLMLCVNEPGEYTDLYHRRLVDGIVVVANRIDDRKAIKLADKHVPAVLIPGFGQESDRDLPSVNSENSLSFYRAVQYLISLGHRRIAFILGKMNSLYSIERLAAYRRALREADLPYDPAYIVESDFSKIDGYRLMGHLLDLSVPPTCVICINDSVTPGALRQILSRGLRIPEDISVLAIGCSDMYELLNPPLTAIKTPVVQVGETAAKVLIQIIEQGECPDKHIILPSDLIVRESTTRCPV